MNNNEIKISEVIESVKNNPETILIVNKEGKINYIPLGKVPKHLDDFSNLIRSKVKGICSANIISKNPNITEEDIKKKIQESIEALEYNQTHNLKPGINIPR